MAARKLNGRVRSGAKPSKSPAAGRMPTTALTGKRSAPRPRSDFAITVPFWSDAMVAWRIEASESDPRLPGGRWQSSIWTESAELARVLYDKAAAITSREAFMAFRGVVMEEAKRRDVRCWRTMLGDREVLHAPAPSFGR